MKNLFL